MPNDKQAIDTTCQKCRRDTGATGSRRERKEHNQHSSEYWVSKMLETMESISSGNERETQHENEKNKNTTRETDNDVAWRKSECTVLRNALLFACVYDHEMLSRCEFFSWFFVVSFGLLVHIRCLIQLALYRLLSGLHSVKFLFVSNKNVIKTIFSPLIIHICKHARTMAASTQQK